MLLSEHVYCVAVTFKMSMLEQQICIRFCVKLEHFFTETTQMIQKAADMGDWWLAASLLQCSCSHNMSYTAVFGETSNRPVDLVPYSPDLAPGNFWLFPKLKSPLKEKRVQTLSEIQENMMGQLMTIERTVWSPKVPTLKETEVLSCVRCVLHLVSFSINVSIFHITWLEMLWTDLVNFLKIRIISYKIIT